MIKDKNSYVFVDSGQTLEVFLFMLRHVMPHQRSPDVVFVHQCYGTSCHACLPVLFAGRDAMPLVTR